MLNSARAPVVKCMRHHLAHQVWQRLTSKLGKRNPARAFWRPRANRYLRSVDDQIEWKMREHMRHDARNPVPEGVRKLRRPVERISVVEVVRPSRGRHLGHSTKQSLRRARTH